MTELVYAGNKYERLITGKFPQAILHDASDQIYTERVEVVINGDNDNKLKDDFYVFAIKEGFVLCCLGFQMMLQDANPKVRRWMQLAGLIEDSAPQPRLNKIT